MPKVKEQPKLVVTSGAEWRRLREEGQHVTLPSGNVARLRPVSFEELLRAGRIPNPLLSTLRRMMGLDRIEQNAPRDLAKETEDMILLMEIVCKSAMLEPRIVDDPTEDDEIAFFDLTSADRDYVMDWVQNPQSAVKPFRS